MGIRRDSCHEGSAYISCPFGTQRHVTGNPNQFLSDQAMLYHPREYLLTIQTVRQTLLERMVAPSIGLRRQAMYRSTICVGRMLLGSKKNECQKAQTSRDEQYLCGLVGSPNGLVFAFVSTVILLDDGSL